MVRMGVGREAEAMMLRLSQKSRVALRVPTAVVVALSLGLVAPTLAQASGADVLRDCKYGQLKSHYSAADYRAALAQMPNDFDNYSDCRDQIQRAEVRDASGQAAIDPVKAAAIL